MELKTHDTILKNGFNVKTPYLLVLFCQISIFKNFNLKDGFLSR